MAISRVKTWSNGEVLTHTDLNAEFNNILNNATSLISPLTGNVDVGNFDLSNVGNVAFTTGGDITNLDELALRDSTAAATASGRLRRNGTALLYHNGSASQTVALHGITTLNQNTAIAGSNYTNATAAYTDVTGYSVTITSVGGSILVFANGPGHCTAGDTGQLAVNDNGGAEGAILVSFASGGQLNMPWYLATASSPAAGSHNFKVRGKTNAGGATLTINGSSAANGLMMAFELLV